MYIGRFAPSPTGPLHAGSLATALASWLDARAHGGRWLVRIEDVDTPRCAPGADRLILQQLHACGLVPDEPPTWQSRRTAGYQQALDPLVAAGLAYGCACSRHDIERAQTLRGIERRRGQELPYPGTCRPERGGLAGRSARAWRLHVGRVWNPLRAPGDASLSDPLPVVLDWADRCLGHQQQDVTAEVGDFVLRRADGLWAYQLAVVADDAAQGVSDVVRGQDLADNTPRQIVLQRALGLPTPRYLHVPLVLAADGEKLSKQNGAQPIDQHDPVAALRQAALHLGLDPLTATQGVSDLLAGWTRHWKALDY